MVCASADVMRLRLRQRTSIGNRHQTVSINRKKNGQLNIELTVLKNNETHTSVAQGNPDAPHYSFIGSQSGLVTIYPCNRNSGNRITPVIDICCKITNAMRAAVDMHISFITIVFTWRRPCPTTDCLPSFLRSQTVQNQYHTAFTKL